MIGLTYEEIIEKIKTEKGLSEEEIQSKIKRKLEQLSDLISKEGAAHIVANELGVKLFEKVQKRFKINALGSMLRNIEIAAKIIKLYEVRSFKTEKREGRLAAMLVGDDTANIRVVIWDEPIIKLIENNQLKEGDVILIKNAYVRENNGFKELHLGTGASLEINPEGINVDAKERNQAASFRRKKIVELKEGDFVSVYGTVVQLFEPRFYEACPECGKKVEQEKDRLVCKEHSTVSEAIIVPIASFFIDDGTDNIRVTCFREAAEKVFGATAKEIMEAKNDLSRFQGIRDSLMGKQLIVSGKVKNNSMFNRLEINAAAIEEANPERLIEEIAK